MTFLLSDLVEHEIDSVEAVRAGSDYEPTGEVSLKVCSGRRDNQKAFTERGGAALRPVPTSGRSSLSWFSNELWMRISSLGWASAVGQANLCSHRRRRNTSGSSPRIW